MAEIKPKDLNKYLNKRVKEAKSATLRKWQAKAIVVAKKEVNERLDKGISPVAGFGKFVKYTKEYAKKRGKPRLPVNLIGITGKMRKTLAGKKTKFGISLFYTSPIAKYHNGKGRVDRFMLPVERGQKFKAGIRSALSKLYVKLFKI